MGNSGQLKREYALPIVDSFDTSTGNTETNARVLADPEYRYERLIHTVGRRRLEVFQKYQDVKQDVNRLTQQERDFLLDPQQQLQPLLQYEFDGIYHFLRSTDISKQQGAESTLSIPTQARQAVSLARLKAFSTLQSSEMTDYVTASQAVRNRLHLT